MPEGPEVRVVTDFISTFIGVKFSSARIVENTSKIHRFGHNPPRGFDHIRDGFLLTGAKAKGKLIVLDMSTHDGLYHALVTLGMSGTWVRDGIYHKHARIAFTSQDSDLTFVDPRCFGTFSIIDSGSLDRKLRRIGHDLLDSPMDDTAWDNLQHHRSICNLPVGEALMQQKLFSGIGNIYKAEIIYECHLDPRMLVSNLTAEQWSSINSAAHAILRSAYMHRGSTVSTFSSDGEHGNNQQFLKIYGRDSVPEGPVERLEQGGRTTWWCPSRIKSGAIA